MFLKKNQIKDRQIKVYLKTSKFTAADFLYYKYINISIDIQKEHTKLKYKKIA